MNDKFPDLGFMKGESTSSLFLPLLDAPNIWISNSSGLDSMYRRPFWDFAIGPDDPRL